MPRQTIGQRSVKPLKPRSTKKGPAGASQRGEMFWEPLVFRGGGGRTPPVGARFPRHPYEGLGSAGTGSISRAVTLEGSGSFTNVGALTINAPRQDRYHQERQLSPRILANSRYGSRGRDLGNAGKCDFHGLQWRRQIRDSLPADRWRQSVPGSCSHTRQQRRGWWCDPGRGEWWRDFSRFDDVTITNSPTASVSSPRPTPRPACACIWKRSP